MPDTEFLVDSFSFSVLNMFSHCLLAYMVSDEKSVVNPIEDPVYMMSCFSLTAFRVLSLSLFSDSLVIMCPSVDLLELILLRFIELYECLDSSDLPGTSNVTFRLKLLSYLPLPVIPMFSFKDFAVLFVHVQLCG